MIGVADQARGVAGETLGMAGQVEAEQTLLRAWRSGRLHHAWLLTGITGIGKSTLAHRFAHKLLAVPISDDIDHHASFAAHPDFLVISRAIDERRQHMAADITLEDVRAAHSFLRRTAARGGWRVVIVDGADHLNRNAANALLKLIEEPPSQALILLVCDAPGRMLPTIRSRCRSLRLVPLDDPSMASVLTRRLPHLSQPERDALISLGHGSPGRAISLAGEQGLGLSRLVDEVLSQRQRSTVLWAYGVADTVLRHENGFATFLNLLSDAISSAATDATRGRQLDDGAMAGDLQPDCFNPEDHGEDRLSTLKLHEPHHWASICAELTRLREETESLNLDKRHAVLACLSLLSE